jgi:hypothetical protein
MAVLGKRADPLVPANLIDPQIPAGVAGVLQCAMALNAADRPASAAEMRQMFRESEKYASLAAASTTPGPNITAAIPQPTRIMPDNTRRADMLQTDIKTEVLGGNMSEQTSIRPGSTAAAAAATALSSHAPRRKARGLAMGVAAVVLIGAVVAVAGLYFARPTFFGVAPAADEQPEKPVVQSADNTDTPPANSATVSSTAEEATAPELQPETQQSEPSERSRPPGTTRTSKVPTGRSPGGDTDITVTDPDASGETTFRDDEGRTITIRPPTPPRVRGQRPTTGAPEFDLNKFPQLTPAERKRMQQAIRNAQRQQMMQQRNYSEPKN